MDNIIFLIFILLFLTFVFSAFSSAQRLPARQIGRSGSARGRVASGTVSRAAEQAMQAAGYHASSRYVQLADIGLLSYRQSDEPKLVRYGDVMLDTQYLRPFAELWLPYDASGPVRFEISDSKGRLRYADEARYELRRGTNTVLPGTWFPLEGKTIDAGEWKLRILANQTLLAAHAFGWQEVGGGEIQRYAASDGEISPSLAQAMQKQREAVSLSDLLSEQEEDWT